MATRRKAEPGPEPERPSAAELHDAIERWRASAYALKVARDLEDEQRRAMVDVLHRAGIVGFAL